MDLLIVIGGKLQAVEIKLTATPGPGHLEPLSRFLSVAHGAAINRGIIVCRTEKARNLPNGHRALPWQVFPEWIRGRLAE